MSGDCAEAVAGVVPPSLLEWFPGVDWTQPLEPPTQSLSARELDVLRYLPTRLSNLDIAARLGIAPNTVKAHLKNVYRKLGVKRRNEAVITGVRLGLIRADDVASTG